MFPDVYLFNPTCEYAVANGTISWQPNRLLQKMEADLSVLPLYFSKPGDYILVKKPSSRQFINSLKLIGILSPNFIPVKQALADNLFLSKPKGKLLPWGWSPATHHLLNPLKKQCSEEFKKSPIFHWTDEYKNLSGKKTASEIARQILKNVNSEILLPPEKVAQVCTNFSEVEQLHKKWGQLMVKAPWSTSGRGLQPVTWPVIHPSIKNRINGLFNEQGFVMVEPYFEKIADMAFQFKSENSRITFLGFSFFEANQKGQYQKNYLNGLPRKMEKYLSGIVAFANKNVVPVLTDILEVKGYARHYEGFFGVDALIYCDKGKQLRLHPCLEINLRYNMGLLALCLEKILCPGVKGIFGIFHETGSSFKDFSEKAGKTNSLVLKGHKIKSGYFPLTDPGNDRTFGTYMLVGEGKISV